MPLAVTHVLLTIIVVDLYRDYFADHKRYFTLYTVLIAGIASVLPDIDIAFRIAAEFFNFVLPKMLEHGMATHTPIFALLFIIPGMILWKKEKHRAGMIFFVIAFGIVFHLFLDYFIGGGSKEGIMWLWPFSDVQYKLHLLKYLGLPNIPEIMDGAILLGWLAHLEIKHKLIDFI